MASAGDTCPHCGHCIIVVNTIQGREYVIRYLGCRECGYRPSDNKLVERKDQ